MQSAARKLIPFGDRVLVKRVLPTSKVRRNSAARALRRRSSGAHAVHARVAGGVQSAGGILLPDSGFKKMNEGVVRCPRARAR